MKFGIIIFNLLILISCKQSSNYNELYFSAKEKSNNGKFNKAIALYNDAIKLMPNIDSVYVERGYNYFKIKNYKQALSDVNKAIDINYNCSKAYLLKGMVYKDLNDNDNAIKAYTHIINISDSTYLNTALLNRASIYQTINLHHKAFDDLSELIELDSLNYEAYVNRGITRLRINKYDNFKDTIRVVKFSKTATNEIIKKLQLASTVEEQKRELIYVHEILNDFNKAIKINSKDYYAFYNRAFLYKELNLNSLALDDANKAIQLKANSENYVLRAMIFSSLKSPKKSLNDFNRAIEINPSNGIAYVNRALLKKNKLNDNKGAKKDFKMAKKYGVDIDDFDY